MLELFVLAFLGLYFSYALIVSDVFRELILATKPSKWPAWFKRWLLGEVGGGDA